MVANVMVMMTMVVDVVPVVWPMGWLVGRFWWVFRRGWRRGGLRLDGVLGNVPGCAIYRTPTKIADSVVIVIR